MDKKSYKNIDIYYFGYKAKIKIKITKFINTELESESESKLESDAELEPKLERFSLKRCLLTLSNSKT